MDYLKKKYAGFATVLTASLQDELLLGAGEFMLMKQEVRNSLGVKNCPAEISFDLFESLVIKHL